ncbi:MAG TPA: NmrA family NAD(P)-binding protein [Candidatus Sulfotelmatobacter sp.]|jgi:NAD(P)H dehydrogenase (quinone)|nr:NmrA family NAD(P)-binding protein [Candidatus Sulfotelmatobacter sp.]
MRRKLQGENKQMFAITGITGQVGGEVARNLLAAHQTVRGVVRDVSKAKAWAERGCEVVAADMNDPAALAAAFEGAEGVFVLVPPNFDPSPDFQEARAIADTLARALGSARPGRVVHLSTVGAQATHLNLLSQHTIIEQALGKLSVPITFLRPGWFMENSRWDVASARNGLIQSFLQPLDKPVAMVATADVGYLAAELLQEKSQGHRVVELEGPRRVTPNEIAASFAKLLGRPVRVEAVPRETWGSLFKSQGMNNPEPRIQMIDGFNEGWIRFEGNDDGVRKGKVELETVLRSLIELEGGVKARSTTT